jgi:hypothetical protein
VKSIRFRPAVQRRELDAADAGVAGWLRIAMALAEIVIEFAAAVEAAVIDLSCAGDEVTRTPECRGQRLVFAHDRPPVRAVGVDAGGAGP